MQFLQKYKTNLNMVSFFAINIILTSDIAPTQNSSDTLCQDPGLSGKELHGNYLSWHQAFS